MCLVYPRYSRTVQFVEAFKRDISGEISARLQHLLLLESEKVIKEDIPVIHPKDTAVSVEHGMCRDDIYGTS